MKEYNAIVVAHYNFTNKEGRAINTTKLIVSLGEYGCFETCTEMANEFEILSEHLVKLIYDDSKKKLVIKEIV